MTMAMKNFYHEHCDLKGRWPRLTGFVFEVVTVYERRTVDWSGVVVGSHDFSSTTDKRIKEEAQLASISL